MTTRSWEIKPVWIAAALAGFLAVLFLLVKTSETISAKPVALWVAVQPQGTDTASVGAIALTAGSSFDLHAVVEAETFSGERIFYTQAKALSFGGEQVPADAVRRWSRSVELRILWFTVEGSPPFRELAAGEELGEPSFQEIFRSDWGQAWTVQGDLRPAVENFLPGEQAERREPRFGTQRFQVRMEFFAKRGDLVPQLRLSSWGAEELPERSEEFPAVVAALPGSLETPSRVFGLSQIYSRSEGRSDDFDAGLATWTRQLVAFSRIALLAEWLKHENVAWEALSWSGVEIGASHAPVRPGDLLRVGSRIVWILEDRGVPGRLDENDLCLDFDRGARVRRLSSVFTGEGLVEWARAPSGAS